MRTVHELDTCTRYWFNKALQWADAHWNADTQLVRITPERHNPHNVDSHSDLVRDSVWYATGLLMRGEQGDVTRALAIIRTIMRFQFNEPAAVYHGTFLRRPDEAHPPENAVVWRDYDPNWREFICTVFIILLKDFADLLPTVLQNQMRHAIRLAAEGAFERKVAAEYTNISLMSAFLLDYAGELFENHVWRDFALNLAHEIHALFDRYQTFNEYNSPTYYGVDLYALALWREYGSLPYYRQLGATLEAELWLDVAQFYHAGMRNLCGPYDRSYGMDLTDYLALIGLWIASLLPPASAPLPEVDQPFEHAADFFFMPLVALVGAKPPDDVLPYLTAFQGERFLERTIEPNRMVTAWLSETLMLGAEADHHNTTRTDQFHPATVHWQTPDGAVSWLRIRCETLIQAVADPSRLVLSSRETFRPVFDICAAGAETRMIHADQWVLPGLTVRLERPGKPFTAEKTGDIMRIQFESSEPITLTFST